MKIILFLLLGTVGFSQGIVVPAEFLIKSIQKIDSLTFETVKCSEITAKAEEIFFDQDSVINTQHAQIEEYKMQISNFQIIKKNYENQAGAYEVFISKTQSENDVLIAENSALKNTNSGLKKEVRKQKFNKILSQVLLGLSLVGTVVIAIK